MRKHRNVYSPQIAPNARRGPSTIGVGPDESSCNAILLRFFLSDAFGALRSARLWGLRRTVAQKEGGPGRFEELARPAQARGRFTPSGGPRPFGRRPSPFGCGLRPRPVGAGDDLSPENILPGAAPATKRLLATPTSSAKKLLRRQTQVGVVCWPCLDRFWWLGRHRFPPLQTANSAGGGPRPGEPVLPSPQLGPPQTDNLSVRRPSEPCLRTPAPFTLPGRQGSKDPIFGELGEKAGKYSIIRKTPRASPPTCSLVTNLNFKNSSSASN